MSQKCMKEIIKRARMMISYSSVIRIVNDEDYDDNDKNNHDKIR